MLGMPSRLIGTTPAKYRIRRSEWENGEYVVRRPDGKPIYLFGRLRHPTIAAAMDALARYLKGPRI
jgi:hypothetical protein